MRILIACEFSGIVREAFKAKGHDAWSCDLLPTEIPGQHCQQDIRSAFRMDSESFELLIAHPPCTYLTVSANKWMKEQPKRKSGALVGKERQLARESAIDFFMWFTKLNIPKIAIENPIGIMSTVYRKPDQIIQPWQFGHGETKATCLWLKGLPPLKPTSIVEGRKQRLHELPPSPDRAKERSKTYQGIADAMANQWWG
jgi:hypothetical protein